MSIWDGFPAFSPFSNEDIQQDHDLGSLLDLGLRTPPLSPYSYIPIHKG